MKYIDTVDKRIKNYFKILEPDFPEWLNDYIETKELLSQRFININCGTRYTDIFENDFLYTSLDHAIGTALITWHFTHDKKETLSGLFHDISTPTFKHCIDFLNGDYSIQESTEERTHNIINSSKEIMSLLKRDNIKISEVDNYHIYPIADNKVPRLCADRLEYSFSNCHFFYNIFDINTIKEIYNDLEIQFNEDNKPELGFKMKKIARKFVGGTSKMFIIFQSERMRYSMQFIADVLRKLNEEKTIKIDDLYTSKESEIISIIESSKYKDIFNIWKKAKKVRTSNDNPGNVYSVNIEEKVKTRYIDPLVNGVRISTICKIAKKMIDKNLYFETDKYVYLKEIPDFLSNNT